MRVSLKWLEEFVDLEDLEASDIAAALTAAGLEIDAVEHVGPSFEGIVTARIRAIEEHPNADKLTICEVEAGESSARVVCGAKNMSVGDLVPMATPGAVLPDGTKIRRGKIRGEVSEGMLCSARELGLSENHDGLMILSRDVAPGRPLDDVLDLDDVVLEIGLTPNRPDCLSVLGVARELAALFGRELRRPDLNVRGALAELDAADASAGYRIEIADGTGCPRYAGLVIRAVRVGPSPDWMVRRLEAVGQRSVNNLVDVTNYAMLENGQPLHAFDLRTIDGDTVYVRRARADEKIETIDHAERALDPQDLLIADAEGALAIAGVMGGAGSEISDDTTEILIECANFDPTTVRRTARRHGMHTESSHRFERGVDPTAVRDRLLRCAELVLATQDAIGNDRVRLPDALVDAVAAEFEPVVIELPASMPTDVLGFSVLPERCTEILASIGLSVESHDETLLVTIPAFRPDLTRPIDLVEEIGRIEGYAAVPSELPSGALGAEHQPRSDAGIEPSIAPKEQPIQAEASLSEVERVRDLIAGAGLYEAVNYPFISRDTEALFSDGAEPVRLQNPLSDEMAVMRTSLMPGLLGNVASNLARQTERVALFELGRVFPPALPVGTHEPTHVGVVLSGTADEGWYADDRPFDAHDASGLIEKMGAALRRAVQIAPLETGHEFLHPGVRGRVVTGERELGWVGRIHPDVLDHWEIEQPVVALEIDLDAWRAQPPVERRHESIPRTQASRRDVALLVSEDVTYARARRALDAFRDKYLERVRLFDLYEGEHVPDGTKSLAFAAMYRSTGKTLTDEQIDRSHDRLVEHLMAELDAERR